MLRRICTRPSLSLPRVDLTPIPLQLVHQKRAIATKQRGIRIQTQTIVMRITSRDCDSGYVAGVPFVSKKSFANLIGIRENE